MDVYEYFLESPNHCYELQLVTYSVLDPGSIRKLPVILDSKFAEIPSFFATTYAGR